MQVIAEPWDYLIITASHERQATAYRTQLGVRSRLHLLGDVRQWLVVADPGGRRVGSGGSTIGCLLEILNRELAFDQGNPTRPETWRDVLQRLRILIIHAGGDSRRLPAYGPCGKIFIPLPGSSDSALGTALLDRQLPVYLALPPPAPGSGQIVIASGDVLLGFAADEVTLAPAGMTGLGCGATPEQASQHGVYCVGTAGCVRRFLQKPSPAQQAEAGAIDAYGQSVLDIGVIHFGADIALKLLEMCQPRPAVGGALAWSGPLADAILSHGMDFYREVCCALGTETTRQSYRMGVRASGCRWNDGLLDRVFDLLATTPSRVQVVKRCEFLHFGTTREIIASGQELLRRDNPGFSSTRSCVSINNRLSGQGRLSGSNAWVEGCRIEDQLTLSGDNLVVGLDVGEPLGLPPQACLDVLPGRNREGEPVHFVRCYRGDDPLHNASAAAVTLCGCPLSRWLDSALGHSEDLWDAAIPPDRRSAWNARLFPAEHDPAAYRRWLWMFSPSEASAEDFQAWLSADRYSLEEMAALADQEAFFRRRVETRSNEIRGSLRRFFRGDSGFSADDLAHVLAHAADPSAWLAEMLTEAHWHWNRSGTHTAADAFIFSRIMHTLGSALARQGEPDTPLGQLFPGIEERLGPAERPWLAALDLQPHPQCRLGQWIGRARAGAFDFLRREIVASGSCAALPATHALRSDEIIWGRAPARLDLAGGWTDTPPFALEHGGCVLNAAVDLNGQPPIQVYARITPEPLIRVRSIDLGTQIEIRQWDELLDHASAGEFSLVKAALVISGFRPEEAGGSPPVSLRETLVRFGGGVELTTLAAIPQGSGLGTSSILGAVLLAVIGRLLGRPLSSTELFHAVLRLEQALTTGGGWQDQIGGSIDGLKLITTGPGLVPQASISYVPADVLDPHANGGQTLLYYTGITRLAKNILEQVVGRYLDRDREVVATLERLHLLAPQMAEAMARKDLPAFGRLVDVAWRLNNRLDPNSTNEPIEALLARIRPLIYGAKLLGAGGGGFLLLVCRSAEDAQQVKSRLESEPPNGRARFFDFDVSGKGLAVTVC